MKNGFELKCLSVKYPFQDSWALKEANLGIPLGEFTVVLGANGSGKSTLLKCLAGVQQWTSGSLTLNGLNRSVDNKGFNEHQILVSEDIILPDLTIAKLEQIYKVIWPQFRPEVFRRIIGYGSIEIKKTSKDLSRGQKILLQFALAIGTQVPIVLVDEVTATLDPYVRRMVVEELRIHTQQLGTVVLATNIASETQHIDSHLILINKGNVLRSGSHHELRKHFSKKLFPVDEFVYDGKWVEVSRNDHGIFAVSEVDNHEHNDLNVVTLEEMFTYFVEKAKR